MIGAYQDGKVEGFFYRNPEVHNILIRGSDCLFCDTFGQGIAGKGGAVIVNGEDLDRLFFEALPGHIVRGLAGTEDQLLIVCSHKGERRHRFKDNGSPILGQNGRATHCALMPFSQVYGIISSDGNSFSLPSSCINADKISTLLEQ